MPQNFKGKFTAV